jgi:Z1 domain
MQLENQNSVMFELIYSAFKQALEANPDKTVPEVLESYVPSLFRDDVFERFSLELVTVKPNPPGVLMKSKPIWREGYTSGTGSHWAALQTFLLTHGGRTYDQVSQLDKLSDNILFSIGDPKVHQSVVNPNDPDAAVEIPNRYSGLVIGYVQSGKTANYTALAAKAFDAGYSLVIVLTGIHNTLRRQTQIRMNDELGLIQSTTERPTAQRPGVGHDELIQQLTSEELLAGDFQYMHLQSGTVLSRGKHLCVTKKNASVLQRLLNWLGESVQVPVLIIDDEADQASINTLPMHADPSEDGLDEDVKPSRINGLIRQLKAKCVGDMAFVAYTATPYSNVFIDMNANHDGFGEDLYPEDFIWSLPKPEGYMGPLEFFGPQLMGEEEGEDLSSRVVRILGDAELDAIKQMHVKPTVTDQGIAEHVEKSIHQFIVATAARRLVSQSRTPSSFLIHTSSSVQDQENLGARLHSFVDKLHAEWRYNNQAIRGKLEVAWLDFVQEMQDGKYDIEFSDLVPNLEDLLNSYDGIVVKVLNFRSDDELDYQMNPDLVTIVVGGNKLSRGLTLEGLLFSYFVRKTAKEPQADTLTQMGRFFGYRRDVVDLTRVFTTDKLRNDFREISQMEESLRAEISLYQKSGMTPRDFAPRVVRRLGILPTARNHMHSVEIQGITYSGDLVQTTSFDNSSSAEAVAEKNLELTSKLLKDLTDQNLESVLTSAQARTSKRLWSNVDGRRVLEFVEQFKTVDGANRSSAKNLAAYIRDLLLHETPELTSWSVGLIGREYSPDLGKEDFGINLGIGRISRSLDEGAERSIGVLVNPLNLNEGKLKGDEIIDFSENELEAALQYRRENSCSSSAATRIIRPKSRGLLLLYPISPNSRPDSKNGASQTTLGEAIFGNPSVQTTLIGLAVVFPHSELEIREYWRQRAPRERTM